MAIALVGVMQTAAAPAGEVSGPVATKSGYVCPSSPNRDRMRFWIHVAKWCFVPGVRQQIQLKVQMKIRNQSRKRRLSIAYDRIRLLVRRFDPDRWTPARVGSPTLQRPVRTRYRGKRVWAIPPNADGAFDYLPNQRGVLTFATHWVSPEYLRPGQTLRPRYHFGDLVYYMPMPRSGRRGAVKRNVVGIGYVKGRDVIALCPPWAWGRHAPAASF